MKRLLAVAAAVGLTVVAAALPEPEAQPQPVFAVPDVPAAVASAAQSIWYCPWGDAGALTNSSLGMIGLQALNYTVTLETPFVGEPPDQVSGQFTEADSDALQLGDIVRRGEAPAFVEFTAGPATASMVVASDTSLAGDACVASAPKVWHLSGGTTRAGVSLTLRLFNPFAENARVEVDGLSEFGNEPLRSGSFDVPARSWRDLDLSQEVPFLDQLSLFVSTEEGLVLPAFVIGNGFDQAIWPGTVPSPEWYFPVASLAGVRSDVVVTNPNDVPVTVDFEVFGTVGPLDAPPQTTIPPNSPLRVEVLAGADGPVSVVVRASGPVSATVLAEGLRGDPVEGGEGEGAADDGEELVVDGRLAATVGSPETAIRWLVAGAGAEPAGASSVWVFNPAEQPVAVTVQPMGPGDLPTQKIQVPALALRRIAVPPEGVSGYVIDAVTPVAVSWSVANDMAVAFSAGVAVGG